MINKLLLILLSLVVIAEKASSASCDKCTSICGSLCVFTYNPIPNIQNELKAKNCPSYKINPALNAGDSLTQCYSFTAQTVNINMQMYIEGTGCSGGTVLTFKWTLYHSTCGAPIADGVYPNMSYQGLTIGNNYRMCYSWIAACRHTRVYPFVFDEQNILPVELSSFDAIYNGNQVNINWTTEVEVNNDYFTVEKSRDGINFKPIADVPGTGNSITTVFYSIIDDDPFAGINYYRLKQTDYDGNFEYSGIVKVTCYQNNIVVISDIHLPYIAINILYGSDEVDIITDITDIMGRLVYSRRWMISAGGNQIRIDKSLLQQGVNIIHIKVGNTNIAQKVLIH